MNRLIFIFIIVTSLSSGKIVSLVFSKPLNAEYNDDSFYDDEIPDPSSRNALRNTSRLWPDGNVYFKISPEFDEARVKYIRNAMNTISRVSCVHFIEAPENASSYVYIKVTQGYCRSQVGYRGGIQYINLKLDKLDTGCFRLGTIVHELMHCLGFVHQHKVPDRDKYVKILFENVSSGALNSFGKQNESTITNLGLPYDFGSIMHYSLVGSSKNGRRTIEPIVDPGNVTIGQREALSRLDIIKINILYKCCIF